MSTPAPLPSREQLEAEIEEYASSEGVFPWAKHVAKRNRQLLSMLPLLPYVQHKPGCKALEFAGWEALIEYPPKERQRQACSCGLEALKAACGLPERG